MGRPGGTEMTTPTLDFTQSEPLTFGVELEMQLVNTSDYNLAADADDLLRRAADDGGAGELKPEITQSMIEINSSVHERYEPLLAEPRATRDSLSAHARKMNVAIAGGGTHPFQKWSERKIYPTERFLSVSEKYGFLAKQFTVFGQHIHIGCASADDAIYLNHAFIRYVPHFIALGASSPFYQGSSTRRSMFVAAVGGQRVSRCPARCRTCRTGRRSNRYFDTMHGFGIVKSMKDFYWDIRPKPGSTVPWRSGSSIRRSPSTAPRAESLPTLRRWHAGCGAERVDWISPEALPRAQLQPLRGVPPRS